jgi:RNA polymerase sigma-B factor
VDDGLLTSACSTTMVELGARTHDTCVAQWAEVARARVDRMLFARAEAGDLVARNVLVERFLPLARSLAHRYQRSGEPMDDLVQVASLALVKALDGFDPALGNAFSSFAFPTIVGALKRHFRDRTWIVRPPRHLQDLALRVHGAMGRLTQELDRAPTVGELAAAVGGDEEQILEALQALRVRDPTSLQSRIAGDGEERELQDTLGFCDEGYALAESRVLLADLMGGLAPRSREVLRLRYEHDMTQTQIGELLGVSQMHVSRLIHQALTQMRHTATGSSGAQAPPAGQRRALA